MIEKKLNPNTIPRPEMRVAAMDVVNFARVLQAQDEATKQAHQDQQRENAIKLKLEFQKIIDFFSRR